MTAERLIAAMPGGRPPRGTKLRHTVWWQAAALFDREAGKVLLRTLCAECGVSHRTAWRMRESLRDAAQIVAARDRAARIASNRT